MTSRERWDELQSRWAQGDQLNEAEERERLAFAAVDAHARRELEAFAALRARAAEEGEPASQAFIDGVLAAVGTAPRLRLVGPETADGQAPIKTRRAPLRSGWLLAGCLVLAAALGTAWLTTPKAPARASAPLAHVARPSSPALARAELSLSAGAVVVDGRAARVERRPLSAGQIVATSAGRACVTVDPTIDVCLAEHSKIKIESLLAASIRIRVESGLVVASLSRRNLGDSFALIAGDISATARGTIFAARQARDHAEVSVVEGTVEVARATEAPVPLHAHARARSAPGGAGFERSTLEPAEEAQLLGVKASAGAQIRTALGVLELGATSSPGMRASIDDGPVLPLPLQSLLSAGRHGVRWRDGAGREQEAWVDILAGETRQLDAPQDRPLPVSSAAPAEKPTPAMLLDAARAEVARSNPRAALALYEKLRALYPSSAEAHTLLPTIGKLELDLGYAGRALRSFNAYLRSPGLLAPEALSGKIRALGALGQRQAEREAIQQYLARYPKGLEAPRLTRRLAELDRP